MRILIDLAPLRHRDFRRLWLAGAITATGAQLTAVAVPLQIYRLTGSSAAVGLAGLVGFVPMVLGSLWGGAVADAVDRRLVLLCTNSGIGVASLLLWAQAAAHLRSVGLLLVLVGLQQACFGANAAAGGAVVPRLVPTGALPAANSLQSTASWTAAVTGPLLAGAFLPVVGSATLYLADATALLVTLVAVWRLPPLRPTRIDTARRAGPGVLSGLRLLASHQVLLFVYAADFAACFLGLPYALFPQLAAHAGGADAVGVLYAAIPVGSVLAGLLSGAFTRARRYGPAICGAVCVWGAAIAGFGLSRSLALSACLLALAGAALTVLSTYRKSALQSVVTDDLRGRLQGADTVVAAGGPRLAGLAHCAAAPLLGSTWTVTGGGLLTIAVMLTLTFLPASPLRTLTPGPFGSMPPRRGTSPSGPRPTPRTPGSRGGVGAVGGPGPGGP